LKDQAKIKSDEEVKKSDKLIKNMLEKSKKDSELTLKKEQSSYHEDKEFEQFTEFKTGDWNDKL
jgi:hypothetical protein